MRLANNVRRVADSLEINHQLLYLALATPSSTSAGYHLHSTVHVGVDLDQDFLVDATFTLLWDTVQVWNR